MKSKILHNYVILSFMLKLGNVGDLLQLVNENNCIIINLLEYPGNFTELYLGA
nr:hypothetical protein [Mycoplasmopsis bovis]